MNSGPRPPLFLAASASRLWLCQSSSHFSSFWFEGKKKGTGVEREGGRSLQNRFSNAIGGGCQRSGVAGEPFMPFHLKKPKGSWRVHSVCVPLLLLMGSALLLAAAYRSAAFYFTSGAHAKKPSSDPEWKKNALMDIYHSFFHVPYGHVIILKCKDGLHIHNRLWWALVLLTDSVNHFKRFLLQFSRLLHHRRERGWKVRGVLAIR